MFKYELENFWKQFIGEIDITIELDEDNGESPTGVIEARYRMDSHGNGHICLLPGSVITRKNSDSREAVQMLRELIAFIENNKVDDVSISEGDEGYTEWIEKHGYDSWRSPEFEQLIKRAKEVL